MEILPFPPYSYFMKQFLLNSHMYLKYSILVITNVILSHQTLFPQKSLCQRIKKAKFPSQKFKKINCTNSQISINHNWTPVPILWH